MHIEYLFFSFKHWNSKAKGRDLIEMLLTYDLHIEKISSCEPINILFSEEEFDKIWSPQHDESKPLVVFCLLRGRNRCQFLGIIKWYENIYRNMEDVNIISLQLNIKKNADVNDLVSLGDSLYRWSEAEYGYIDAERNRPNEVKHDNIFRGIDTLYWVNYFGNDYISDNRFNIPPTSVHLERGLRFKLYDRPENWIELESSNSELVSKQIGCDWFRAKNGDKAMIIPEFYNQEIFRASN